MKFYYIPCSSPYQFCFSSGLVKALSKEDAITKLLSNYEIECKNIQKDHKARNPDDVKYWTDEYISNLLAERKKFVGEGIIEIDESSDVCRYDEQFI